MRFRIFLFAIASLYILTSINRPIDPYDEGIPLTGAFRILHGEVPYRDFWTIYAPGQFYTLAGIFSVLGTSALYARIYDVLIKAGISLLVFLLSDKLLGKRGALVPWFVSVLWLERIGLFEYSIFPALLFLLLSANIFLRTSHTTDQKACFLSGLSLGICAVYRQDFGFYGIASMMAFLAMNRATLRQMGVFGVGFLVPTVFVYGTLSLLTGTQVLVLSLIKDPVRLMSTVRAVSFPSPGEALKLSWHALSFDALSQADLSTFATFYLPVFVTIVSVFFLIIERKNKERWQTILLLTLLLICLVNQGRVRADLPHLIPSILVSIILFFGIAPALLGKPSLGKALLQALFLLFLIPMLAIPLKAKGAAVKAVFQNGFFSGETASAASGPIPVPQSQLEPIRYIENHTSKESKIAVLSVRHDYLSRNDASFYFLSGRLPGIRYYELHPGVADTESVQEEIVNSIRISGIETIVLADPYPKETLEHSSEHDGSRILDDFISKSTEEVSSFPGYRILILKTSNEANQKRRSF